MGINWTVVASVVAIGIIFMFTFRRNIGMLIDRIKSVGKGGVNLEPHQSENRPEIDPDKEAEKLMNAFNSEMLLEQEGNIHKELTEKNLKDDNACKVLVRHLAATQIALAFEIIHKQIWGSQIKALEGLNVQTEGMSRERIKIYYDETVENNPVIGTFYTFEQWLTFLKSWSLALEQNNKVLITVRGIEFLLYLTRHRLNKNLAF